MSRLVRYAATQELPSRKGCALELKVFKLKINKLRTSIQMLWLLFLRRFPFHVAGELGIAGMPSGGLSCGVPLWGRESFMWAEFDVLGRAHA